MSVSPQTTRMRSRVVNPSISAVRWASAVPAFDPLSGSAIFMVTKPSAANSSSVPKMDAPGALD